MKKILPLLIMTLFITSCSTENAAVFQNSILVETKTVFSENTDSVLSYMGVVKSDSLKKYSFKSGGKLKSVQVSVGQAVNEGDILLELDKSDMQYQVDAAKNQADAAYSQYEKALTGAQDEDINAAKLNVEKAQAAYDYAQKLYEDIKTLFDEGAVSESSFKEAELSLNIAEKELEQAQELLKKANAGTRKEDIASAKSQYGLAQTNYDAIKKLFNDATLICDTKGYVADILYEAGEIVPQGYPAILVQSENQVISIGATQEDVEKLSLGMTALITINNENYNGKIVDISQTPDDTSRTFNVDIFISDTDKKFYIGSIGQVELIIGQGTGIYIEIPYILNDGVNYVYIVEENKAVRKNIDIVKIEDDKALVNGLSDNDQLIVNGTKNIKDGFLVEIKE
ncbi:MAG: HlyD family efflux transporter periplasmic adaptor subunit [Sedimentibacter sp.]|uniref:efflux RND transporter periplasmic adaptor subunit n=1 Tax=Sedimentibacter sp. TaxID=1960295 RepID=UPI002980B23B|nr:biotin/lipoyl-binding protein [Sedimentibacter sp.]MDW5299219.1 HlyD family efflux transporter periplasmic adaptor subunit [Sedimentibacter sp.]